MDTLFESHIATLPETERPKNRPQERRMFVDWEDRLKSELTEWKDELDELKSRPIDKRLIFNSTKNKAMHLLQREAPTYCLNHWNYQTMRRKVRENGKRGAERRHLSKLKKRFN